MRRKFTYEGAMIVTTECGTNPYTHEVVKDTFKMGYRKDRRKFIDISKRPDIDNIVYNDIEYNSGDNGITYSSANISAMFWIIDREFNPSDNIGRWVYESERNDWRDEVLREWNNQCVVCNSDEDLHAHHLNNVADHPIESLDIDNGIILCEDCHKEFHSWMGGYKNKCTKDDFNEWFECY